MERRGWPNPPQRRLHWWGRLRTSVRNFADNMQTESLTKFVTLPHISVEDFRRCIRGSSPHSALNIIFRDFLTTNGCNEKVVRDILHAYTDKVLPRKTIHKIMYTVATARHRYFTEKMDIILEQDSLLEFPHYESHRDIDPPVETAQQMELLDSPGTFYRTETHKQALRYFFRAYPNGFKVASYDLALFLLLASNMTAEKKIDGLIRHLYRWRYPSGRSKLTATAVFSILACVANLNGLNTPYVVGVLHGLLREMAHAGPNCETSSTTFSLYLKTSQFIAAVLDVNRDYLAENTHVWMLLKQRDFTPNLCSHCGGPIVWGYYCMKCNKPVHDHCSTLINRECEAQMDLTTYRADYVTQTPTVRRRRRNQDV